MVTACSAPIKDKVEYEIIPFDFQVVSRYFTGRITAMNVAKKLKGKYLNPVPYFVLHNLSSKLVLFAFFIEKYRVRFAMVKSNDKSAFCNFPC